MSLSLSLGSNFMFFYMSESEVSEGKSYSNETIRCICGFNDDDGFTVQCEKCLVWQHCACVAEDGETLPEIYYCERCNPDRGAYNVQVFLFSNKPRSKHWRIIWSRGLGQTAFERNLAKSHRHQGSLAGALMKKPPYEESPETAATISFPLRGGQITIAF